MFSSHSVLYLLTYLYDPEAEVASVKHDDLVFVSPFIQNMSKGEQRGRVGQHRTAPGRVALVSDHKRLLVSRDRFEQHR